MRLTAARLLVFIAGLLLVRAPSAGAHAFLDHADPKVGSERRVSPAEVRVWFSDDVSAGSSSIEVFDADGKQVDKQDCHGDAKDAAVLAVSLPSLEPGVYRVRWRAVCPQGHKTHGEFKFVVRAKS